VFILRNNKRQDLQNDVGEKCPYQVFAAPGIEERYVDYGNVCAALLGKNELLFLNFVQACRYF
jgi:hypothetical protein